MEYLYSKPSKNMKKAEQCSAFFIQKIFFLPTKVSVTKLIKARKKKTTVQIIQRLFILPPPGSAEFVFKRVPAIKPTEYAREVKIGAVFPLIKNEIARKTKPATKRSSGHCFMPCISKKTKRHKIKPMASMKNESRCI